MMRADARDAVNRAARERLGGTEGLMNRQRGRIPCLLVSVGALALAAGCTTAGMTTPPEPCDSACLESLMSNYLDALAAKDPGAAPVADDVVFSENGVIQPFGEASWLTMEARGSYWLPITDPAAGQAAVFTSMTERGDEELMTLRIKAEGGAIVEAEQMIVRPSGSAFGPIIQESPDPRLLAPVPPEERVGREELIAIADSYFEGIDTATDSSITPFTDDCQRRENGNITAGGTEATISEMVLMDCKAQFDTGFQVIVTDIRDRRIEVADVENQLVFAYGFFDHSGVGSPTTTTGQFAKPFTFQIAEVFKVRDGEIEQIEAILFSVPYRLRTDFDRLREAQGVTPNHGR